MTQTIHTAVQSNVLVRFTHSCSHSRSWSVSPSSESLEKAVIRKKYREKTTSVSCQSKQLHQGSWPWKVTIWCNMSYEWHCCQFSQDALINLNHDILYLDLSIMAVNTPIKLASHGRSKNMKNNLENKSTIIPEMGVKDPDNSHFYFINPNGISLKMMV